MECCGRRVVSDADTATARIDYQCIVGRSRADMGRLDRRVGRQWIRGCHLVDLCVLRAGIRQ